jgi:hypothetical protein
MGVLSRVRKPRAGCAFYKWKDARDGPRRLQLHALFVSMKDEECPYRRTKKEPV